MDAGKIVLIVVATLLCVAIISLAIWSLLNERWKTIVIKTSERLKDLQQINERYSFLVCDTEITYPTRCKSKREFDRFDYLSHLKEYLLNHQSEIEELLSKIRRNKAAYEKYMKEVQSCETHKMEEICRRYHISCERYIIVENRLSKKEVQAPALDIKLKVTASYISPQGRNHYYHGIIYGYWYITKYLPIVIQEYEQMTDYQRSAAAERAKMTDSLRYDIMKRDGFRCQLCGATASDGVTLHIDHIVPVSKGGKTVPSNLRTLCSRCNMGKRDKLE